MREIDGKSASNSIVLGTYLKNDVLRMIVYLCLSESLFSMICELKFDSTLVS